MRARRSTTQRFADERLGQPVEDWVRARQDEGSPLHVVAGKLREATNGLIDVHPATIARWMAAAPQPAAGGVR